MTTLALHRERFQAEQAPARSSWLVATSSNELAMVQQSSLAFGPVALPGGYAPCFGTLDFATKINPEVDR